VTGSVPRSCQREAHKVRGAGPTCLHNRKGSTTVGRLLSLEPALNVLRRDRAIPDGETGVFIFLDFALVLNSNDVGHLRPADVLLEVPLVEFGDPLLLPDHGHSQPSACRDFPHLIEMTCVADR
jgi:hypothetical protein